jgi:ketosteroid isomerase-like protein
MDSNEAKQLVMNGYKLYQDKKMDELLALYHDDVEWVGPDSDFLPFAGTFHGKTGVVQFFTKLNQSQEALKFEPQQFIADGDKVVVIGTATWQVRANGQTYENPWVHIFTIRDGKVARFEQFYNAAVPETAIRSGQNASASQDASLRH